MASTYVLAATVKARLHTVKSLDLNDDGTEDTGLLDSLIEEAGDFINMSLAQKLAVPFANITDDPPTPTPIQKIALHWTLWSIYALDAPGGADADLHKELAREYLAWVAEGKADVDGAARQTAAKSGTVAVYTAETPAFSGRDDDDVSRTGGI